ncbi:MAG: hypothetical protein AAF697_05005 [Pseudomonadota bacterium]
MKYLAFLALIPLARGPFQAEQNALVLALCSGAEITIPIEKEEEPRRHNCHQACHAGNCREEIDRGRFDRDQGRSPKA